MDGRKGFQVCTRCVMDTEGTKIEFDENGVCNFCHLFDEVARQRVFVDQEGKRRLQEIVAEIKEKGKNKEYDCILGVSGGVDSSFVAYQAKGLGLRPLLVHFDNGWNSEISVQNIENLVRKLEFDLFTYVIDWGEFRDIQISFFKASVPNIELVTDHAIMAAMYKLAKERRIKYILSGWNIATEGVLDPSWGWPWWDIRHIKAIQKRFGTRRIKNFPTHGLFDMIVTKYFTKFKHVEILNYMDYRRREAAEILEREIGWKYYGGKHYESTFTKFYQAYILPRKFNIDKRKAHLSALVCSGQITREEALEEMKRRPYEDDELHRDKKYVLKKLGFTEEEFEGIMNSPVRPHSEFKNNVWLFNKLFSVKKLLKPR